MTKALSTLYLLLFASLANAVDVTSAPGDRAGVGAMAVLLSLYISFCVGLVGLAWYKTNKRKKAEVSQ